jgi:hypothetical protein
MSFYFRFDLEVAISLALQQVCEIATEVPEAQFLWATKLELVDTKPGW